MSDWKSRAAAVSDRGDWRSRATASPGAAKAEPFNEADQYADAAKGMMNAADWANEKIDRYAGAPFRAASNELLVNQKARDLGDLAHADWSKIVGAAKNQFGEDPEKAPKGIDIAANSGIKNPYAGAAFGTALDLGGQMAPFEGLGLIGKIPKVAEAGEVVSGGLRSLAERLAVNATGATGKEAARFAPNAGRELLDQGIVRFGSGQSGIAKRAGGALEEAEDQISQALEPLQKQGVTVDRNDVYNAIKKKIKELSGDESQASVVRALEQKLNDVVNAADKAGVKVGAQDAEKIKRGFSARNWADPDVDQANKQMYLTYRDAVENAARGADPALANKFEAGKKAYGLMEPIQEAAANRARVDAQSPLGGFRDLLSLDVAGWPGLIARRVAQPRLASSAATSADALADIARMAPDAAEGARIAAPYLKATGLRKDEENLDQNQTPGLLRLSKRSNSVK